MPFRTKNIQIDGSLNIDGSLFQWQVPFVASSDISTLYIESYVNSSSYYDASLMYWKLPNPSTGLSLTYIGEGYFVNFTAGTAIDTKKVIYCTNTGRVAPADADASTTMPGIGFYLATLTGSQLSSGNAANFLILGSYKNTTISITIGKQVYVDTQGEPTTSAPTGSNDCVQVIGITNSPRSFIARPSPNFIQLK